MVRRVSAVVRKRRSEITGLFCIARAAMASGTVNTTWKYSTNVFENIYRVRPYRFHDAAAARAPRAGEPARGLRPALSSGGRNPAPGCRESEASGWRYRRADGLAHVGPTPAAPSPRPLRRTDGRFGAGRHPVDPRPSTLLPPDRGLAETLSRQARRRHPGCLSSGVPRFPWRVG